MRLLTKKYVHWELFLIPILTAAYQAFAKLISERLSDIPFGAEWLEHAARTPYLTAILVTEALSFFLWLRILAVMDVSRAVPLTAVSYVLIVLMGWLVFHEPLLWQGIVGSTLILSGILILGRA